MIVYELSWWYFDEETEDSDEQIIAVYSSMELAKKAIEKFKTQPRFIGHYKTRGFFAYSLGRDKR